MQDVKSDAIATTAESTGERRVALGLSILLVALLAALLGATGAQAFTSYANSGSFGSEGSGPGQFQTPGQVAVDDSTGNVLVVDSGNARVQVWSSGGPSATHLTDFGVGELSYPIGIAIDQTTHAVYVADAGNEKIYRYLSDGQPVPTYSLDPSYESPPVGTGPGELDSFNGPLAIDPTNGDLLVGENNSRIVRFEAGGGSSSFTGTDAPSGGFHEILGIAVTDDGTIYVVDWEPFLAGVLDQFAPDGTATGNPPTINQPHAVAYDPHSDNLVLVANVSTFQMPKLVAIHDTAIVQSSDFPEPASGSSPTGLAVDGGGSGRVYVATKIVFFAGTTGVQVFDPAIHPGVAIYPAANVTARTAHLSGSVDPDGVEAYARFEYSKDGGANWSTVPASPEASTGTDPVAVAADLTGLTPNSDYLFRLIAANGNIPDSVSANGSFHTAASAPDIVTGAVGDLTPTAATLHGTIASFGKAATYHFEYGTTTDYGSRVPLNHEAPGGSSFTPFVVSQSLAGLQPETTYHYRLVATNPVGQSEGADRTFTTPATPSPARAYELVSPVDKGGVSIETGYNFQSSLSGDQLIYGARGLLPGGEAAPASAKYSAVRGQDGWTSRGVDPPQAPIRTGFTQLYATLAVSQDGSKAVVISLRKLADGAVEGDSNIYLRDTATGAYETIGTSPGRKLVERAGLTVALNPLFAGGTDDFSHVLLFVPTYGGCCSLLPGAAEGSYYEYTGGHLRLVSVQPDGVPFGTTEGGPSIRERELNRVSADGSKIWFNGPDGALYVRIDGSETRAVSVSQRTGDPNTPRPAQIHGVSRDGNIAFFVGTNLTDDSTPSVSTLYRYVLSTNDLSVVSPNVSSDANEALQVSADGKYVYFVTYADLGGGSAGSRNVYVWHDGVVSHVVTLDFNYDLSVDWWLASPNGRYFAIALYSPVTDYDSRQSSCSGGYIGAVASCREVYRYSADDGKLVCVSCKPDGGKPTGDARIGIYAVAEFSKHFQRFVTNGGDVFFDTPDPLVKRDSNSSRDVYEYVDGQAQLISAGKGPGASELADVSADGSNVFFTTLDRLVPADTDDLSDVYDARVGGGIASQGIASENGECKGTDCRVATTPPPPPPPTGSEGAAGPGNASARKHQRCAKGRKGKGKAAKAKTRCTKHKQRAKSSRRQSR